MESQVIGQYIPGAGDRPGHIQGAGQARVGSIRTRRHFTTAPARYAISPSSPMAFTPGKLSWD